jgi:hypothetical protein
MVMVDLSVEIPHETEFFSRAVEPLDEPSNLKVDSQFGMVQYYRVGRPDTV